MVGGLARLENPVQGLKIPVINTDNGLASSRNNRTDPFYSLCHLQKGGMST